MPFYKGLRVTRAFSSLPRRWTWAVPLSRSNPARCRWTRLCIPRHFSVRSSRCNSKPCNLPSLRCICDCTWPPYTCHSCGDTASSWLSMMSLSQSALQVRLHRLWLRFDHRWDGRIPDLHPFWLSHLCLRSRTTTTCSRCPLPLATRRLQPAVGQSWDGGNPGLAPPVALAGVCTDTCSRPHVHGRLCCTRQCTESDVSLQELITSQCVSERHYTRSSPPDVSNLDTARLQVISDRISCLEIATLPSSFTSSNK